MPADWNKSPVGSFERETRAAGFANATLIWAMVEDGFFTEEQGKKLILFYNMYFAQPERGVFHCTAGRGALSLVTDIPRTTERGTPFDLELLNTILDRLNKLDGK